MTDLVKQEPPADNNPNSAGTGGNLDILEAAVHYSKIKEESISDDNEDTEDDDDMSLLGAKRKRKRPERSAEFANVATHTPTHIGRLPDGTLVRVIRGHFMLTDIPQRRKTMSAIRNDGKRYRQKHGLEDIIVCKLEGGMTKQGTYLYPLDALSDFGIERESMVIEEVDYFPTPSWEAMMDGKRAASLAKRKVNREKKKARLEGYEH